MLHGASFHKGPHCLLLLVPRRSFEKKKTGMLTPIRLRIYVYAHLNERYIDYNSMAFTRYGILRLVVCVCAVNHGKIQYAASIAQLEERQLSVRGVVGSNPVAAPYQRFKKWY